jgi:hypothetical protein
MELPNYSSNKYKFVKSNQPNTSYAQMAFKVDNRHSSIQPSHNNPSPVVFNIPNTNPSNSIPNNRYIKPQAQVASPQFSQQIRPSTSIPNNRYIKPQAQVSSPQLSKQMKTSSDLDELLKRCNQVTEPAVPTNSNKTGDMQSKPSSTGNNNLKTYTVIF